METRCLLYNLKTALLYFSDLNSEISAQNSSLPSNISLVELSISKGNFKENSIFHSVVDYLKSHTGSELISVCIGQLPNWAEGVWENHLLLAKEKGSSIYLGSDEDKASFSLQTFNVPDLKMALDQNYRPVFEDIYQAYNMFGFKAVFFTTDNVVN